VRKRRFRQAKLFVVKEEERLSLPLNNFGIEIGPPILKPG
jgi:hypothetical protein